MDSGNASASAAICRIVCSDFTHCSTGCDMVEKTDKAGLVQNPDQCLPTHLDTPDRRRVGRYTPTDVPPAMYVAHEAMDHWVHRRVTC